MIERRGGDACAGTDDGRAPGCDAQRLRHRGSFAPSCLRVRSAPRGPSVVRTRAALAELIIPGLRALVVVLVLVPALVLAQQRHDTKGIVGYWTGAWKAPTGSGGFLSIAVDAVDGENVRGVLFMAVTTPDTQGYYNRDVRFFGVFDGTTMRITVPPALILTLTLNGRALRGDVQGQQTFGTVALEKKP
jgi:hypothetical protein